MNEPDLEELLLNIPVAHRHRHFRRGSSDTALVGEIFLVDGFDLSRLPRMDQLREWPLARRSFGRRPLIVAIECETVDAELLVTNTEGLPILPLPMALSNAPARLAIGDHCRRNWRYRTTEPNESSNAIHFLTVTMDETLGTPSEVGQPFIVKIDIEGAEAQVL